MRRATESFLAMFLTCAVAGCGGSQSSPAAPSESEPSPAPPPPDSPPGNADGPTQRPELTAEACAATGGAVVGDIGDGAIHRADYRCPSGSKPSGSIRASQGAPISVEGSVCCPK
jgi:hypothetical protein